MVAFAAAAPGRISGASASHNTMTDLSFLASIPDVRLTELRAFDPCVIGATGGSGTRVVGRIVRSGGMYTGTNLNDYEDALDLAAFSDRWINQLTGRSLDDLTPQEAGELVDDLTATLEVHRRDLPPGAIAWGWKEPRSIYLLALLDAVMPNMRFLHFIRDGRDMAFSDNQQQLKKHGDAVLGKGSGRRQRPIRSISLWSHINTRAADYGERNMPGRYLRMRFEDLCAEPARSAALIYDFFELRGDAAEAATAVRPPDSLGRWQSARKGTLDELHETAGPALERFGYLAPS
jgi:sulfotransferase family protein